MTDPVRILIVDDHNVFGDSLAGMFSALPGFRVVAHQATVAEAVRTLSAEPVDVVLLDFQLRDERGSALINWAASEGFKGQFLIVTAALSSEDAAWLIRRGVAGIILKEKPFEELLSAVNTVARGGKWLDQPFLKLLMTTLASGAVAPPAPLFTERERATLRLLIDGCTNKEIGKRLVVSESAVKSTLQRLFEKVGVRNRGQLIRVAIQKYQNFL